MVVRKCYGRNAARTASSFLIEMHLFSVNQSLIYIAKVLPPPLRKIEIGWIRKLFLDLPVKKVAGADTKWSIKNDWKWMTLFISPEQKFDHCVWCSTTKILPYQSPTCYRAQILDLSKHRRFPQAIARADQFLGQGARVVSPRSRTGVRQGRG